MEGDFLITPDEKVPEALGAESAPRVLLEAEPVAAAGFLDLPDGQQSKTSFLDDGFNLKSLAADLTSSTLPKSTGKHEPEADEWSVAALISTAAPSKAESALSRDDFLSVPDKFQPPSHFAIGTPMPALVTATADHSTAAPPEPVLFQPAAFAQFPPPRAAELDHAPAPDFDEPLSFPVPSALGVAPAAHAPPGEIGDPADRGFGMVISGALLILLGLVMACRIPGLAFEADSTAAASSHGPAAVRTWHLHGEMFLSAAGAAALLLLGIGSATLRRWAPPLVHAAGWVVLLTVLVCMGAATVSMFYLSSNTTAGDAVSGDGTLVFALTGIFGIALPLGLIALFQRPSISSLCKLTDKQPRWTDRRSIPALMVFITGVLLTIACFTLSVAHAGMPLFGEIGDGRTGIQAWAGMGIFCGAAAACAAAGKRAGWWMLLILSVLVALSLFFTCQRHDWRTLMHLPAAPSGSLVGGLIAASAMLPAILILLMTRRALAHHGD